MSVTNEFGTIQAIRASETIILYHKDCMDGIAAAYVADCYFNDMEISHKCIPIQYGDDIYEVLGDNIQSVNELFFVDFSAKRDIIIDLATKFKKVTILDHHKTAEAELKHLDDIDNIEMIFDMNRSGAVIAYDYFTGPELNPNGYTMPGLESMFMISDFIQDRDLWNWKLENSKEVSEYFKFTVKPNDLESFKTMATKFNWNTALNIGETLTKVKDLAVASKVKKYRTINIAGIELVCINLTENISEVGNELCKLTGKPAMMYFIKEDLKVVLSFRSLDELPDVSIIAKFFDGGGHRNACGATTNMEELKDILENYFDDYEIEETETFIIDEQGNTVILPSTFNIVPSLSK